MTIQDKPFSDIAPYDNHEFHDKLSSLVKEPGFEHAVKWVMPNINWNDFSNQLLQVKDGDTFQTEIMMPFLELLAAKTTSGLTCNGLDNIDKKKAYSFITNHRDIVLDTSFLNLCLLRAGYPTTEVAIGDNLLIYTWISDLVRLNKSFIVKRNLPRVKALEAAKELSGYIHYAVTQKNQSIWIAERQGRSKDSSDLAQDALIKMLGLGGSGSFKDNLLELNILPVSISYEYDPNDYLKAREFLLKRNNPDYKKTQRDDLFAMETGLLQPKGRVHYEIGHCLNPVLEQIGDSNDKSVLAREVCHTIDCQIHAGYKLFPINYVAFDQLYNTNQFADMYTQSDVLEFNNYIASQVAKVEEPGLTDNDRDFLHETMLTMYANPLKNNIQTENNCSAEFDIEQK
ncbi:MAG: acyltransferase [Muribaculum sp.]|nr:acyltransferase [Muribaculaceae bacterium]MCM1080361.1 acyltransferase [Muribaculum sp.]